jgi:hypothetical protein
MVSYTTKVLQELAQLFAASQIFLPFEGGRTTICDMKSRRRRRLYRRLASQKRRTCVVCRVAFKAIRTDARHCSPRCRQRAVRAKQ